MKSKTELAKEQLMGVFRLLTDNAFADARYKIGGAIRDIEKVESKRSSRETLRRTIEDEWKEKLAAAAGKSVAPQESLGQIEKMIEDEKNKIKKNEPPQKMTTFLD